MTVLEASIDTLARLVAYPTVSADPNRAMIADLAGRLEDAGAAVEIFEAPCGTKANLWARLGPERPGGVLLSGHTDVVPTDGQTWTSDPFTLRQDGGRLYARGACDMKGFVACALTLANEIAPERLSRPLWFAFTHDEEVGCLGARALVDLLADRPVLPRLAIIGEPTQMRIIDGHKGCCEVTTRFTGRAGHGSRPDLGVNAVAYAVRYAARLIELAEALKARAPADSRFAPPWTTVNLGRLGGGHVHNVIPSEATLDWEMRPVQDSDAAFVHAALDALVTNDLLPEMRATDPAADIVTDIIGDVAGLHPEPGNPAQALIAALTGQNGAELAAFSTEAGLFQALGVSAAVCGPGSIAQAHKPDEYIEVGQLAACCDLLMGIAETLKTAEPPGAAAGRPGPAQSGSQR